MVYLVGSEKVLLQWLDEHFAEPRQLITSFARMNNVRAVDVLQPGLGVPPEERDAGRGIGTSQGHVGLEGLEVGVLERGQEVLAVGVRGVDDAGQVHGRDAQLGTRFWN